MSVGLAAHVGWSSRMPPTPAARRQRCAVRDIPVAHRSVLCVVERRARRGVRMAAVGPASERGMMRALHVTKWCTVGQVPAEVSVGLVPKPAAPKGTEVLVGVKAFPINVDDVAFYQVLSPPNVVGWLVGWTHTNSTNTTVHTLLVPTCFTGWCTDM